jgi:lactoylglutathione lyase
MSPKQNETHMKLEHLAIWAENIDSLSAFFVNYFGMSRSEKYINASKGFSSYFLNFGDGGSRIEIMHRDDVAPTAGKRGHHAGLAHFAISVGSKEQVNSLTEQLRKDGFVIQGEPRTTGDGYYESVVLDPEGNVVEITE